MWRRIKYEIKLWWFECQAASFFNSCRDTGGESSPYMENYLYWDNKVKELKNEKI